MSHLKPVNNFIILAVLILFPVSMAHAQGGKANTTTATAGKSWNAALGSALQETTLNPGWADVDIAPSTIAGQHVIVDFPDTGSTLPVAGRPKTPNTHASAESSTAAFTEAPKQASPPPSAHTKLIESEAQPPKNPESAAPPPLKREAVPAALPIVNTTLNLVPGKGRLASALVEFARANGWEIAWEIDRDFPVDYPATFHGPFLEIITSVVTSLHTTDAPIRAKIYHANKVVRIIHATR